MASRFVKFKDGTAITEMAGIYDLWLTGKGSGPSCITNPSITCVSICGFTMARCFSTGGSVVTGFGTTFSFLDSVVTSGSSFF